MAMAGDDTHLYWVEYGTRDSLGNYQNDGALMSWAFESAVTTTLASRLPGPLDLAITESHAIVYTDGAPLVGRTIHPQVLRISLSGGNPEVVQEGEVPTSFAAVGGEAFWSTTAWTQGSGGAGGSSGTTAIYSISGAAGDTARVVVAPSASYGYYGLTADATHLYYGTYDSSSAISRVRHDGSAPEQVLSPFYPFGVRGAVIDGIESVNHPGIVLDEGPTSGGTWQRARALGAGDVWKVQFVGDRLYLDSHPLAPPPFVQASDWTRIGILTARLAAGDPPIRLLERNASQTYRYLDHLWVGTARALYWSDGRTIYAQMVP
jgi:hypothetical protein